MGKAKANNDVTFLGLRIPMKLSLLLDKDSAKHFRTKSNHILWILTKYCGENTEEGLRVHEDKETGAITDYMGNPVNIRKGE